MMTEFDQVTCSTLYKKKDTLHQFDIQYKDQKVWRVEAAFDFRGLVYLS